MPAPGKYGSDTYYSSDAEEADLQNVAEVAESVDSIGSARTGVDSMLIRVPLGSTVPQDQVVGRFTVQFEESRFTAVTLASLLRNVSATGEAAAAAHERIAFAFGYEALPDLVVVHGTAPGSLIPLAITGSGLSIAGDASPDDGRLGSRSG